MAAAEGRMAAWPGSSGTRAVLCNSSMVDACADVSGSRLSGGDVRARGDWEIDRGRDNAAGDGLEGRDAARPASSVQPDGEARVVAMWSGARDIGSIERG